MNTTYLLKDINLCVGMILRDMESSGIYSYVKILEIVGDEFFYDYSEDWQNFNHGFRRNGSDLLSDRGLFDIIHDPRKGAKRSFIYYIGSRKTRRNWPGYNLEIVVYELVNNVPKACGNFSVSTSTASYKGEIHETMNYLSRIGVIGKEFDGYYKDNNIFSIVGI